MQADDDLIDAYCGVGSFGLIAADKVMNRLAKNNENASVIIATAPKKGLLKGFIEASVKMRPREFIYLSFNPDTLVRDLKFFK